VTMPEYLQLNSAVRLKGRLSVLGLLLLLALPVNTGCRVVQSTGKAAVDPVELQQQLMRFADEFTARMSVASDQLRRGTNSIDRVEQQKWKLNYLTDTLAIASGQNSIANLLDMLVLTTTTRIAIEEHWLPKVYGESARPMLEDCRRAEGKIWTLAAPVLKPEQAEEFRKAIRAAYNQQPNSQLVPYVRALSLAAQISKDVNKGQAERSTSVFSLLQIDPFAGLDPAAREIARSRLFAERALYVAQRMPLVIRWQTELLSYQMAATPEVEQVLTNLNHFGQTAEALTRATEQFPRLISNEREAAIEQVFLGLATERTNFLASLASEDVNLRATLVEVRQTLDAANELTRSLDTFVGRFDKGTNAPVAVTTNARPFDILDYAATAKEVTTTLKELNASINSFDQTLPQVQSASDRLINRLFYLWVSLIGVFLVGALVTALVYRWLTRKISQIRTPAQNSKSD